MSSPVSRSALGSLYALPLAGYSSHVVESGTLKPVPSIDLNLRNARQLKSADKLKNPAITTLPAEVTFRVRKRGLVERLHFMFMGD